MIIGEEELRKLYPDLDDNQYQPAGIDLKLGKIMTLENSEVYGLVNGKKFLPEQKELEEEVIKLNDTQLEIGYLLQPHVPYIAVVDKPIKIPKEYAQVYKPRSSCLRGAVTVSTAVGDPGFNGHLSFLVINHLDTPFFIQKGERFAQMVTYEVKGVVNEYDGDYNE